MNIIYVAQTLQELIDLNLNRISELVDTDSIQRVRAKVWECQEHAKNLGGEIDPKEELYLRSRFTDTIDSIEGFNEYVDELEVRLRKLEGSNE